MNERGFAGDSFTGEYKVHKTCKENFYFPISS